MNRKDKWLYQNFTGSMSSPDEYQQHEIDKTLAKCSIIGLYTLIALVYFSIFFDIERSFLSPFTIGGVCLLIVLGCRMSISKFSAEPLTIEVSDSDVYQKLLRETRNKRIIFLMIAIIYMLLTATVIAPILAGNRFNFDILTEYSTYLPLIIITIFTVTKDSRIKLLDERSEHDE
ncbi:hypothetical protein [Staphylococcus edaphicus]|uniref:DUF3278 domain-containing protein n=1 Tax=Staphylococcus edaphicus TaxID=1955013 RepID=A0A2C6U861_9STAP|nr:hypothetical protein [Staphylococcus edaphicus]PHK49992.1 hypothetical protein BTJ66_05660 [Staphylococcus edaphicus]UQW81747.1 hypothetical protein MNY58_01135 [Staphylococcus edaphicus]